MYAVIETGGKQYKVSEGDVIFIEKLEAAEGEAVQVDGISGATVSSKAVARCVSSAVGFVTGADVASSATTWGG